MQQLANQVFVTAERLYLPDTHPAALQPVPLHFAVWALAAIHLVQLHMVHDSSHDAWEQRWPVLLMLWLRIAHGALRSPDEQAADGAQAAQLMTWMQLAQRLLSCCSSRAAS